MKNSGFSLIELIIFVIVLGIAASIITTFNIPLIGSHYVDEETQALELAQQRLEVIIRNPLIRSPVPNLSNLVDVCPAYIDVCNTSRVSNYFLRVSISNDCNNETDFINFNGNPVFNVSSDCRIVIIKVYYTKNGNQVTSLEEAITNHS